MIELAKEAEARRLRALPIGIRYGNDDGDVVAEQTEELAELMENLDMVVFEPEIIKVREVQARFLVGPGKAEEIVQLAQECEADTLVFDVPLTPSQQRNWERLSHMVVMDREEVILEIFSRRAQTRAAVLQVELARANYYLSRLTRAWTHLSRQQGGGATTRGEGETQIETDRRIIRQKIQSLRKELKEVSQRRETQRKLRLRRPVVQVAIVGYTNVGKSSLLAALSGTEQYVKNQLFATLDPTARRVDLGGNREVVLTDTVGFIRKLPHTLIEAFKSTLEEAVLSDFLVLVLDISDKNLDNEWETTIGVLNELGADTKQMQVVFNKIDRLSEEEFARVHARLDSLFPDALYVSVKNNVGIDGLRRRLADLASKRRQTITVALPPERYDLVALAYSEGQVIQNTADDDGGIELRCVIPEKLQHLYSKYLRES